MALKDPDRPDVNREKIATSVTYFVLGIVSLILVCATVLLSIRVAANTFTNFKDIVGMVLPLLGTWIGTVLAYYFSKSNFDATTKSLNTMATSVSSDQRLKDTRANDKDVMIPLGQIVSYKYSTAAEMEKESLTGIIQFMTDNKVLRLPFIDAGNIIYYCIHRSIFDKFISLEAVKVPAQNISELTFGDFLGTPFDEIKNYIKSGISFLRDDATLYDVKLIMDSNKYCQDVFLTQTAKLTEPITGWITDVKILEKSRV